ncbi:hypothetical protein M758_8G164700 [Ceratodon purpureus]|nr:hypothetical protein M758_8G164700 [Ceratodon purpureus]
MQSHQLFKYPPLAPIVPYSIAISRNASPIQNPDTKSRNSWSLSPGLRCWCRCCNAGGASPHSDDRKTENKHK